MARILVVDDDCLNLRLAATVLEQAGHEVLCAQSGAQGIDAALAHLPDLVLMDVQMPDIDGITALARLRADPRTAGLKVVAFTALAMVGDAEQLVAHGFDGYITKPIRYQAFLAEVAALLGAARPGANLRGGDEHG